MTYSDNYANTRYPYLEQVPKQNYSQSTYIQPPVPVKLEANDPPSLHSTTHYPQQSLAQFSRESSGSVYRFGSSADASPSPNTPTSSFTFMASHPWPPLSSAAPGSSSAYSHPQHQYASDRMHGYSMHAPVNGHAHPHAQMTLTDEYDDGEDDGLSDLPSAGGMGVGLNSYGGPGFGSDVQGSGKGDKQVRRRSSKACDQCRKSKCKCERTNSQEPCRNCVMLGTGELLSHVALHWNSKVYRYYIACTFLGPSRKRGPPKGYIDAIEARLHQTEALIGILLSSKDNRAKTLLNDLREVSIKTCLPSGPPGASAPIYSRRSYLPKHMLHAPCPGCDADPPCFLVVAGCDVYSDAYLFHFRTLSLRKLLIAWTTGPTVTKAG